MSAVGPKILWSDMGGELVPDMLSLAGTVLICSSILPCHLSRPADFVHCLPVGIVASAASVDMLPLATVQQLLRERKLQAGVAEGDANEIVSCAASVDILHLPTVQQLLREENSQAGIAEAGATELPREPNGPIAPDSSQLPAPKPFASDTAGEALVGTQASQAPVKAAPAKKAPPNKAPAKLKKPGVIDASILEVLVLVSA